MQDLEKQNKKIMQTLESRENLKFSPLNDKLSDIYSLNKQVNNEDFNLKVNQIEPSELKDTSEVRKGSKKRFIKHWKLLANLFLRTMYKGFKTISPF